MKACVDNTITGTLHIRTKKLTTKTLKTRTEIFSGQYRNMKRQAGVQNNYLKQVSS